MTDTTVTCTDCKTKKKVSFYRCLQTGWPQCCGQTMHITNTRAEIGPEILFPEREAAKA